MDIKMNFKKIYADGLDVCAANSVWIARGLVASGIGLVLMAYKTNGTFPKIQLKSPEYIPVVLSEAGTNLAAPVKYTELKRDSIIAFIARWSKTAQEEQKKFGIPASITLAQALVESRSGTSFLAVRAKNFFGIKCQKKQCFVGHCVNLKDDSPKDFFIAYESAWWSFRAHSEFLAKGERYRPLFASTDYKVWAKGLKEKGYATDEAYEEKLISVIEKFKLHDYDLFPNTALKVL
jgi:flagellum-specific peptidoglycan hydrolase FlgJ